MKTEDGAAWKYLLLAASGLMVGFAAGVYAGISGAFIDGPPPGAPIVSIDKPAEGPGIVVKVEKNMAGAKAGKWMAKAVSGAPSRITGSITLKESAGDSTYALDQDFASIVDLNSGDEAELTITEGTDAAGDLVEFTVKDNVVSLDLKLEAYYLESGGDEISVSQSLIADER